MKTIVITLLLTLFSISAQAEPPTIENAAVTIPYGELKALLDAARRAEEEKPEPKPPVEAALTSARYRLDFSGGNPTLTAEFSARTFTDAWHTLPLIGGEPRLESEESSESVSVVWRENAYALMIKGEGDFSSLLTLSVPRRSEWTRGKGLRFSPAAATQNELRVIGLPKGQVLRIDELSATENSPEGEMIFHLSGDGRERQLYLEEATEMIEAPPIVASSWTLHSQILARYVDGRLLHSARIQAQADSGSGLSMTLSLPANVSRVSVEGEDLKDWKLAPRTAESRTVQINWETRDTLDRSLLVTWEIPQSPLADSWLLSPPLAISPTEEETTANNSRTLLALVPVEGLELTHPSLQASVESQRLPEWLREQLGSDDSLTAEILGQTPISLAASWLPRLETAQATISIASFETRLVADGSMLVMADYTVQHGAPLNWKLTLPSADQILTCEINHQAARPIQRADNEIEFRLPTPKAIAGEEGSTGTTVHLCYALKSDPLDPVSGRVGLELPQTELFIHRLDWSLAIPDLYEPTAIEGNVQLSTDSAKSKDNRSSVIRLEKELCRGERPAVEIYYQRKDLTTQS